MSVVNAIPMLLGDEGYQISRSVRLRSSASAYFNRTPSTASNRRTWTWSGWVKRGRLSYDQAILLSAAQTETGSKGTTDIRFGFNSSDQIGVDVAGFGNLNTTAVFRDPSAWYHVVLAMDTTQATQSNRFKIYINGVQQTVSGGLTINQNDDFAINNNVIQYQGLFFRVSYYYDGYLTEINFIDGQALTPSSFGETDTLIGVWKPKKYTGTYGTNGFLLNFSDNSSNTATTIGKDYSGNGNNWTPNNISVTSGSTYDSMLDVPTLWADGGNGRGNYATLNPLSTAAFTISNANLNWSITSSASNALYLKSTIAVSSGKWYWEVTPTDVGGGPNLFIGIQDSTYSPNSAATDNVTSGYAYKADGNKVTGGTASSYGASYTNNDVIGVALDMDAGTLVFYKNNTSQGTAFSSLSGSYLPLLVHNVGGTSRTTAGSVNYGQRPFTYTPPTGFKSLNTTNLPASTIVQGNQWMDATTYTGTGATQSITNSGSMQPDLVWLKTRSTISSNLLYDAQRGALNYLSSNQTAAEASLANSLTAFNSNGFALGSDGNVNGSGTTFVGWQWKAGGTPAVTNTAGSITSTVSASTTSGVSIATYTGTGANATVGHGLGVAPKMIIWKNRSATASWVVWHTSFSAIQYIYLNLTNAVSSSSGSTVMNSTLPTSSVFSLGTYSDVNGSGNGIVAYCFAEVAGFSRFGSYTGNGSADGPFVFLGFRPRWVMVKKTNSTGSWAILDSARDTYNQGFKSLYPDLSNAEVTIYDFRDFLSNGFKLRTTDQNSNGNGDTYIYAAFAENPFKYSLAR